MRVTIWLVKLAILVLSLIVFQGLAMKVQQPMGAALLLWVGLAIPPVALLEALGLFAGLLRWLDETRPRA